MSWGTHAHEDVAVDSATCRVLHKTLVRRSHTFFSVKCVSCNILKCERPWSILLVVNWSRARSPFLVSSLRGLVRFGTQNNCHLPRSVLSVAFQSRAKQRAVTSRQ